MRTALPAVALVGACTQPQGLTPKAAATSNHRFIGATIPYHPTLSVLQCGLVSVRVG